MHEKKVIFYMFRKNKQATKNCGLNLSELDTTLRKQKTVPRENLEKLKAPFPKSCLYHLIKLNTPLRSFRLQSKHLHGSLPEVAVLYL